MLAEKSIHSIDLFKGGELVASIITDDEVSCIGSHEIGYTIKIGESEMLITAEKVEFN